jgi:hypothetical protein
MYAVSRLAWSDTNVGIAQQTPKARCFIYFEDMCTWTLEQCAL